MRIPNTSGHNIDRLLGEEPLLGVEAAAGAGKTHLACTLAFEFAGKLAAHQEVLFLSHTNAARDVFRRRLSSEGRQRLGVSIKTLDTFCLELISPYASLWRLPIPLRPPSPMPRDWFTEARRKAANLLDKRPEIARAVMARYPVVLADEHQDASIHHHSLLVSLSKAGARVRMFGDALQAILTFDRTIPGWDELMRGIPTVELSGAWRWVNEPALGQWIADARASLRSGGKVSLSSADGRVQVFEVDGSRQVWTRNAMVLNILRSLREMDSLVVLSRRNDQAKEAARVADLGLIVNEGSDQSAVEEVVAEVLGAAGNTNAVASSFVDFMVGCGSLELTTAEAIRSHSPQPFQKAASEILTVLDQRPDLSGLVLATRLARRNAQAIGWAIAHPVSVDTVARMPVTVGVDEIRDLVFQAQRSAIEGAIPVRCASTIHKAKGREFDNVVLPWIDAATFGPDVKDRQLLYVGLSRAKRRLILVVPRAGASPLVSL